MSSVKKKKLIIGAVCVMTAVVIAALCIFITPTKAPVYGGNDAIAVTTSYTVGRATYSTSNAARTFSSGTASNSDDGFMDVLYPTIMYLDKNPNAEDSLSKAGYYFRYYASGPGGSAAARFKVTDVSYGYWEDPMQKESPVYKKLDDSTGRITESDNLGDWLIMQKATASYSGGVVYEAHTNTEMSSTTSTTEFYLSSSSDDVYVDVTMNLNGRVKDTTAIGNYYLKVNTDGNTKPLAEWTYNKTWGVGQGFQYFPMYHWRSGRTYKDGGSGNKITGSTVPFLNYDFRNYLTVQLVIYDGSELEAAINRLQSYIDDSYVQSIASDSSLASARTKISEAQAMLVRREKTQSDIDTKVSELDNFKFDTKTVNLVKDIHTPFGEKTFAENIADATAGNTIDYTEFFNVEYILGSTSLNGNNFAFGDWISKNFYLPATTYNFRFSAKNSGGTQITRAGYTHTFDVKAQMYRGSVSDSNKLESYTNGQNINVYTYIDAPSNDTLTLANNSFVYDGKDKVIGGQYSDTGTGIYTPQFHTFASSMGSNYVYQYSLDGNTWSDRVTLTDAGTYNIYFRIYNNIDTTGLISNRVQRSGTISGGVSIQKADVELTIGKKTVPYGGDLPTQDTLLDMITDAPALYDFAGITANMTIVQLRQKIGSMIELSLSGFDMENSANNFARSYTMNVANYKNMEGREKSWGDNVVISFKSDSNQSCYTVDTIKIELVWTGGVTSEYDGQGGKRPTAVIQNINGPLQQSDIIDAGVTAIEGSADGYTPELAGSTAVNYGRYTARVRLRDYSQDDPDSAYLQNYSINNPTCEFGISKRNLTVEIKATGAVYGSATANDMVSQWTDLANNLDSKISITRGSIVAGQSAPGVFRLDIDKSGRGGNAGVPDGGVYMNVGSYDISGIAINNNYNITFMGSTGNGSTNPAKSTFTVRKANLNMNLHQIAPKRYNGQEQAVSMTDNDIRGSFLYNTEYDIAHMSITYSLETTTGFSDTLTVKHVNVSASDEVIPYIVYYRVESDNYEDFGYDEAVSFEVLVTRLPITVVINASSGIKYGNSGSKDTLGYPTSAEIKDACIDEYYTIVDEDKKYIDLSSTMEFYLTNAEEGKKLQAGSYTVGHKVKAGADDKVTNYNFEYQGIQTSQYVVERAELHFEWTVWDASEWGMNGTKPTYVYDDTSADKMLTASGATSGGKITIIPRASEVYYGDVIEPQVELRNGSAGSEEAFDRNVGDKVVYAHLRIGGGNIANYDLKTNWFEFEIVKRTVNVKLKGATYTYGTLSSASSSETGLGALSRAQKRWEYAAGNEYTFVSEYHHMAYGTFTPAKAEVDGQYVDVGRYPLYAGPLYAGEAEYDVIYNNYEVIFSGSWSATDGPDGNGEFNGVSYVGVADVIEISKAAITRTIPLESEQIVYDSNAHTISTELFKTRLSNPNNGIIYNSQANAANVEVWFSNILASTTEIGRHEAITEGLPAANENDSAWAYKSGTSPEMTEVGTYDMAVWIRNVKNYNDLIMGVYVQITPSSIIITLSGKIDAVYGNALYSDEELKQKVSDLVVSIKETGDNGATYDNNSLESWIKKFAVVPANGASMTTINDNVGDYTIQIAERNTVAEGFTLQFMTNGGAQNSYIVGAYHVNPRPVEVTWGDWSYTYGEHSHPDIVLNKVSDDDDIYIDIERDVRITDSDGGMTGVYNNHARDKGSYKAEIMSISGTNGSSASASMCKYTITGINEADKVKTLTVTARDLTVKLHEQAERTYGEAITVINALETYLYQTPSTYEIVGGTSLANNASLGINDNNNVRDVFTISISYNAPAEYSNEYVSAGIYDIIGTPNTEARGGNYNIKFVDENNAELKDGKYVAGFTVNNAEIRANRTSKELIVYDGKEHDVIIREIGFILQGDGHVNDENVGDGDMEDGIKNKLVYTISYMHATSESNTLPSADDAGWGNSWKVRDAGDYYNYIKVEAANHNPLVWKVSQTVAKVDLLVNVTQTSVTYGDEVPSARDLNTALKPEYKFTYNGSPVTIENAEGALAFKVVGQGGDTALSGILNAGSYRVVCYAEDGSDNYNITYADLESGDNKCNAEAFVVKKKQLSVSREEFDYAGTAWQNKTTLETIGNKEVTVYSYIYDGNVPEITVNAEGALDDDNVTVIKTIVRLDERVERVDANAFAGLYALELSIAAGSNRIVNNYEIPQNETLYYRIERREVEIEIGERLSPTSPIGDRERTYGMYKGNVPEGGDSLVHQHNANDDSKKFLSADGRPVTVTVDYEFKAGEEYIPVGEYEFKAECTNENYVITVVESHKYIVHSATPQVHRDMYNTTYNGAPLSVDLKEWLSGANANNVKYLELAGDVTIDDITVQYKVNGVYENRMEIDGITGEQAVTVEYTLSAPNHTTVTREIAVNIARARLVISMNGVVRTTYGDAALTSDELYSEAGIYTNTDLAVDLRDIMTFNVSNGGIAAGRYNIGYEFNNGVNSDWFIVSFEGNCNENAYIVAQKGITLVWNNDELRYNGVEQAPTLSIDGVLPDDTCTAIISGDRGVNAGSYTVSVSSISNPNYVIAGGNASYSYTILPKVANLTWGETQFVFNGEERVPTVEVNNLARPDDVCEVAVEGATKDAGTWTATAVSLSNSNYELSADAAEKSVAFVIEQATLRVGWEREGESFVYSGSVQTPAVVISGEKYGEECNPVLTITKADGSEGDAIAAGSYHIVVADVSNSNFKLVNTIETDYVISKKGITFNWNVGGLVYTGEEQLPAYSANGIVASEEISDVFDLSGAQIKAGKNYTAVATLKSGNYTVTNGVDKDGKITVSATFDIERANNVLKVEYDRIDWVSGEKPSLETLPQASFGSVTIKYYTDEAMTKEYTGAFDENTPEGRYWVAVTTETTEDYIGTTTVYSFEVTSGTKVELYVISIAATIAMMGAGLLVTKTARKKRV